MAPRDPYLSADEFHRRAALILEDMEKVNLGSPRMAELTAQQERLYKQKYGDR